MKIMKTSSRLFLLMAGLSAAISGVCGAEPERDAAEPTAERGPRHERRVLVRHGAKPHERETVAFLGVETARVSPTLTAQLGLPEGAGLVVRTVVPESPAASVLQPHDVLLKLDEQLLIESRQLATLIRHRKEGDEISLTYLRQGKQAAAKVKLASHTAPKLSAFGLPEILHDSDVPPGPGGEAVSHEEMNRMLSLLDGEHPPLQFGQSLGYGATMPHVRAMRVDPENSNLVFSDDEGELALTIKDGKKTLVAKDAQGKELFSGAVDTAEQRAALPGRVRERLEQLETMDGVSFRADRTFRHDSGVREFSPRKISIPPRVRALKRTQTSQAF